MNSVRGYIFSRHFQGERVPQHIQNLVIRDFCHRNNFNFLLSATEYAMEDCFLILEQVLLELESIQGIVLYSLFQLPAENEYRNEIYEKILRTGNPCYFAVEGLKLNSLIDKERIENIWKLKLALPHSLYYAE